MQTIFRKFLTAVIFLCAYASINADRTITINNITGSSVYASLHRSNGNAIRPIVNGTTLDRDGFQIIDKINLTIPTENTAITLQAHLNDQPSIAIPIAPDDSKITLSYDARWRLTYTNSK